MSLSTENVELYNDEQRNDDLVAALEDLPTFLNNSESTLVERLMKYVVHVCENLKNIDFHKVGFRLEDSFKALMSYEDYYNSVIPDRERLVALGGYVAHVCKCVADNEVSEDICMQIVSAVDYEICKPIHKTLNAMWQEWNYPKTGEYKNLKTLKEMNACIFNKIAEFYPRFLEIFVHWFELDMEEYV